MSRKSGKPAGDKRSQQGDEADATPASPGPGRFSPWQSRMRRLYHRAGLPLRLAPDDRLGWLYVAIKAEADDEVRRLVELGVDVDALHEEGYDSSCLEVAIRKGDLTLVEYLVRHGADVNREGKDGPPLALALQERHLPIYEFLHPLTETRYRRIAARRLDEARRSEAERERTRRFSEACSRRLLPTARRLLEQGVDVDCRFGGYSGKTPLALAVQCVQAEVVDWLLAGGADVNLESYAGLTPLMLVRDSAICRRLLEAGAEVDAIDDQGRTALMIVKDKGCRRLIEEAGQAREEGDQGCERTETGGLVRRARRTPPRRSGGGGAGPSGSGA